MSGERRRGCSWATDDKPCSRAKLTGFDAYAKHAAAAVSRQTRLVGPVDAKFPTIEFITSPEDADELEKRATDVPKTRRAAQPGRAAKPGRAELAKIFKNAPGNTKATAAEVIQQRYAVARSTAYEWIRKAGL